ncbi:MAG: protein phosphatase 2C domain-containing protein [Parafilimonas sp.]
MADNFYGVTDAGKMRDNNEDNFIAQTIVSGKYIAGCVIDGVGGYEGGEVAAALARTAILNTIKKTVGDVIEVLKKSVIAANQKIITEKQTSGENTQMACVLTIALADINENKFYYAHVGDTRLYLFRDNSLVKVTHDHSFVGFLEDSGRLTEEAAMQHPKRNEINKALGFDDEKFAEADYIETGESPFLPGDILLLCSDGLSDMLNSRTISGILNSPQSIKERAKALVAAANLAGGKDNITVVLLQNNKLPLQQEATKPVVVVKKNEPIKEEVFKKEIIVEKDEPKKRSGGIGVRFLAVLCFLSLAALSWFVYNDFFENNQTKKIVADFVPITKNANEKKLYDSINNSASKEVMLKNIFGETQAISLNDSLFIRKDSVHISGNGITLTADSLYKGAAFIIPSNCKYILLDSITFQNFDAGIVVRNKALHLKNVTFQNCRVPVLYEMQLQNNKPISANILDSVLLKIDSVKIVHK